MLLIWMEKIIKISYSDKVCLIIGSEGFGLSKLVKQKSDVIVKIPMNGKVNSLNASVATGILLFGMEIKWNIMILN